MPPLPCCVNGMLDSSIGRTTVPPCGATVVHQRLIRALTRRHAWIASALWMAVIFGFSSLPGSSVPGGVGAYAHFGVYAVLGALLFLAYSFETADRGRAVALAVLTASAYGVTDELHQAFVPGRVPDVADWGMDTLGALTGALIAVAAIARIARGAGTRARRDQTGG